MSANTPCLPDAASCWTVPAEFVRLRYFFGQRLGVVDLSDEQGYVVGKQRFHNLRAHGAGVLCGLRAERYVFPAGSPPATPTTLLLIRRGAALDACGREIIVGWDQCIDVAAWFRQNLATKPELKDWSSPTFTGERRLFVAVRYRECPSDPSPAPRDPCGCETTGCDFGRVREGFELMLATISEAAALCPDPAATVGPQPPLERAALSDGIRNFWQGFIAGDCPEPPAESWLCLASFVVGFDIVQNAVTDVQAPDNAIAHRLSLLPTAMLQDALGAALTADGNDAFLGPGPRITGIAFEGNGTTTGGELHLAVSLLQDGPATTQLAGPVAASYAIQVHRFQSDGSWPDVTPAPTISYAAPTATTGARFVIKWTGGLADGERYRVAFSINDATPVVDTRMRPLLPRRFARHFRLINQGGTLTLAPTLFDA